MKTNFTKIVSLLCALVMVLGIMPFGAFAADVSTGHHAQISEQLVYDVDLSIGGNSKVMDTDIVFILYGPHIVKVMNDSINLFMPLIEAGSRVRIGAVGLSEAGKEVILDLNNDPLAVLPNDRAAITELVNDIADKAAAYTSGVNVESAMLTARDMLAADTSVPADRKYLFNYNGVMPYFFDNDEGKTSTVPVYDNEDVALWGDRAWKKYRNNSTSSYAIPSPYASWDEYWADIVSWIAADQDQYVYTLNGTFANLNSRKTTKDYGYTFCAGETVESAAPHFKPKSNPATTPNAAHAIAYERAMYEAWLVHEQMSQPAGTTVTSVLKDENGNPKTYEALGFNCFTVYAGGVGNNIGYGFWNMLSRGELPLASANDWYKPIEAEILHTVSSGSFVENKIGSGNGYDFYFVADASALSVDFGGVNYKATATGANTFTFSADGSDKVSFELIYSPENETFKFITYETPNNTKIANLNYQVKLAETPSASADDKMYVSASATLTPVDSEGVEGEEIVLARPYVINWAASEIEIEKPEHFVEFADVTNGKNPFFGGEAHSFVDQTIKLGNDIDLGDYWWYFYDTTVGTEKIDHRIEGFRGIFDGQDHTIYNVKFHAPEGSGDPSNSFLSLSMFRNVYGTLKNFTIENVGGYFNNDRTDLLPVITGPSTRFFTLAYRTRGALIQGITAKDISVEMMNPDKIRDEIEASDVYTSFNGLLGVVTWESGGTCGNGVYTKVVDCHVIDADAILYKNNQYAGGAFVYKASEMSEFYDCTVSDVNIDIKGNSDNFGGFIGEIGLASIASNCHVNGVNVTIAGQNNYGVGGFMGDTVGGTGWGDSVHINGCTVSNTSIEIGTLNAPFGGFVGDLIGGRSAIFGDTKANVVASSVTLKANGLAEGCTAGVGGFLGGLTGRKDLTAASEHQFYQNATQATIRTINAPAGGFIGAATMAAGNQMRVIFDGCVAKADVKATNATATGFGGYDTANDIGTKGTDKNWDEYVNCTSASIVDGVKPENYDQVQVTGGVANYTQNLADGYVELKDITVDGSTVWATFQDPSIRVYMFRRSAVETDKIVNVEFYRKNAEGEYELWRTIEIFKDTAFDGTGYPYAETSTYRLAGGLASVLAEADDLFTEATAVSFIDEFGNAFADDTVISSDIKVYAEYGYKVTYEFAGDIPANAVLPEEQIVKVGDIVEIADAPFVQGYEFLGWSIQKDFEMEEGDVVIIGKWREGLRPAKAVLMGKGNDSCTYVLTDKNTGNVVATAECADGEFSFKAEFDAVGVYNYFVEEIDADGEKTGEKVEIKFNVYEGTKRYKAQIFVIAAAAIAFN